jgi:hypothetical protein
MLDLLTRHFARRRRLRLKQSPLVLDSTCFERRHRSARYDRRCRRILEQRGNTDAKTLEKPGKWGASVNASRRRQLSTMPKLSIAVAASCHLIVAAKMRLGNGSDAPDFDELLFRSWKRAAVKTVVADRASGHERAINHRRGHRPRHEQVAQRPMETTHGQTICTQGGSEAVRTTQSVRDGSQHDQAERRIGTEITHAGASQTGNDATRADAQHHASGEGRGGMRQSRTVSFNVRISSGIILPLSSRGGDAHQMGSRRQKNAKPHTGRNRRGDSQPGGASHPVGRAAHEPRQRP